MSSTGVRASGTTHTSSQPSKPSVFRISTSSKSPVMFDLLSSSHTMMLKNSQRTCGRLSSRLSLCGTPASALAAPDFGSTVAVRPLLCCRLMSPPFHWSPEIGNQLPRVSRIAYAQLRHSRERNYHIHKLPARVGEGLNRFWTLQIAKAPVRRIGPNDACTILIIGQVGGA